MKILVVCQYYYPEPFRISDLCEEIVKRGHEVTVLTGVPNYPEGVIYKEYKSGKKRDEVINGVRIHRCFTIGRRKGILYRFLNYYSFAISSTLNVLLNRNKPKDRAEYDVVFVNQLSPVMMAYAGILYKKLHHRKLVMYCLDLWPESLVAGGITRDSTLYKIFHKISKHIYRSCDLILVTSRMFVDYISNGFGIDKKKLSYLPQYAEDLFGEIEEKDTEKNTVDFVFAGNIGEVQNVETIIRAAECIQDEKTQDGRKACFHIIGNGTDLERLKQLALNKNLKNVIFYGRKPITEMTKYYELADAMLVTLGNDPVLSLTLPGKVQSYMAAGKPIIGAIDGEAKFVVCDAACGFIGNSGDYKQLFYNIKKFMQLQKAEQKQLGLNAKKYYQEHFAREIHVGNMEKYLFHNRIKG